MVYLESTRAPAVRPSARDVVNSPTNFWDWAEVDPERTAIVDSDDERYTYRQLRNEANRLANAMWDIGLRRGDVIAAILPNGFTTMVIYLAAIESGLYYTPLNFHLTAPEMRFIVEDCGARVLISHERFAEVTAELTSEPISTLEQLIAVGNIGGALPLSSVLSGQGSAPPPEPSPGQRMLYTSGTTGRPRGVKRPLPTGQRDNTAEAAKQHVSLFEIERGSGCHLLCGPMYHGAPLMFATTALHLGHSVVIMDKWTPERTVELIEREQVTTTHMVPTMFHRLLRLPDPVRGQHRTSSLQNVIHAAAPCPPAIKERMMEWWGPILYEYYGATETGTIAFVRPRDWLSHPGTVGQPPEGVQIKVLDDEERKVARGVAGQLCVLTPQGRTFSYHNDPAKTQEVKRGEWVIVPDIGYIDGDGWLFLCDRSSDVIISGGVNIYPAEVESVLLEHPSVAEAAVFSIPSEEWGEEIKAVVEPAPPAIAGSELEADLLTFCRSRIAHFKCPRSIDFRANLPRYTSGKLYRRRIRDEYWQSHEKRI